MVEHYMNGRMGEEDRDEFEKVFMDGSVSPAELEELCAETNSVRELVERLKIGSHD